MQCPRQKEVGFSLAQCLCVETVLFLGTTVQPGRSIYIHHQLGVIAAVAVDHVPHQTVAADVPVQQVNNGSGRSVRQHFVAAMLLRHFISLVRVNLEERYIESATGSVTVLEAMRTSPRARPGGVIHPSTVSG